MISQRVERKRRPLGRTWALAIPVVVVALGVAVPASGAGRHIRLLAPSTVAPSGIVSGQVAARYSSLGDAPTIANQAAPANVPYDRPTMSASAYAAAKAAAAAQQGTKPASSSAPAAETNLGGFQASNQCAASDGCYFPPDINGAVGYGTGGAGQIVTITNEHYDVYKKQTAAQSPLKEITTSSLFSDSGGSPFDPRVLFDTYWQRWVAIADTFAQGSSGTQTIDLAISTSSDATGGYVVYHLAVPSGSGHFIDYPQLGITQDALIITWSDFQTSAQTTNTIGLAKAVMYNGFGFSVPQFTGTNGGTLTPPIVLDANTRAHLLEWLPNTGAQNMEFRNPQAAFYAGINGITTITGIADVGVPPSAPQPGTCPGGVPNCLLDTLDGRYQNDPVQYGKHEWTANAINLAGFAGVQWDDLLIEGTGANTVNQGGTAFASGTSYDWNPSITAAPDGRALLNWSTDDPTNGLFAGIMWNARLGTDPLNTLEGNQLSLRSSVILSGDYDSNHHLQRWGDTSSIQMDPSAGDRAWSFNEWVPDSNHWGTAVFNDKVS